MKAHYLKFSLADLNGGIAVDIHFARDVVSAFTALKYLNLVIFNAILVRSTPCQAHSTAAGRAHLNVVGAVTSRGNHYRS
jgi:hypothetical protein